MIWFSYLSQSFFCLCVLSGLSHYRLLRRFLLFGPSTRCCARNKHLLRPSIVCRCRYCCPGWLSVVTICLVAMNITRTNAVRALFLHHFLDLGPAQSWVLQPPRRGRLLACGVQNLPQLGCGTATRQIDRPKGTKQYRSPKDLRGSVDDP